MSDGSRGGLSPLFPAETPTFRGNGRKWVAILLAITLIVGALVGFVNALL
ncbi:MULTISPECIES: hypothetical protein [Halolamina]|uniref:Uncharacterized protein n=1 Tax=Halolamina pelagica TaxID=699431 RepID=A0A1I5R0S2_9EURY|nr:MULTISPECIES: hypothetical protein [Halolamina]NHX35614.1 hypothetical protein [Halolamina sp. R1-12]SFP51666.1 hypothetical protein SAMN05216277_104164 [Halolamina pelagica]